MTRRMAMETRWDATRLPHHGRRPLRLLRPARHLGMPRPALACREPCSAMDMHFSNRPCRARRWGHRLAAHAYGRGRGSRSLLAHLRGLGPQRRGGSDAPPGSSGSHTGAASSPYTAPQHGVGPRSGRPGSGGGLQLHDASYEGCVALWGHQRDLAALLRRIS